MRWSIGYTFAVWLTPTIATAQDLTPLPTFNQSPLVQIYGLPALGSSHVLTKSESEVQIAVALANNFTGASQGDEALTLDGETHRTTLALRRGVARGYEVGVELPYVEQTGGFLDHTIDVWHDTFGLPNRDRNLVPHDRLLYRYTHGGQTPIDVQTASDGIGDVRLTGARQVGRAGALRMSIKLRTGTNENLRGSGATDVALWLSSACTTCASLGWYGGGGVLWLGRGDVLPDQQRRWVGFGGIGASWPASSTVALKAQIDAHTAFYRSELAPLSSPAAQLQLGGTWSVSRNNAIDFAVSEDIVVNTSPDVVFNLAWRARL